MGFSIFCKNEKKDNTKECINNQYIDDIGDTSLTCWLCHKIIIDTASYIEDKPTHVECAEAYREGRKNDLFS